MIYSVVTRPVLQIMRNRSGRGPIPMRQSVTKNSAGEIDKYNHSKWMTITGRWDGSSSAWVTFNGSANWSLAAFGNDEQMQRIRSVGQTRSYLLTFQRTWNQKTSKKPPHARFSASGRALPDSREFPRARRPGARGPTSTCSPDPRRLLGASYQSWP